MPTIVNTSLKLRGLTSGLSVTLITLIYSTHYNTIQKYSQTAKANRGGRSTIASIWRNSMLGYFSAGVICFEKQTVFRERSLRKTGSFEEQIMFKGKNPSIF